MSSLETSVLIEATKGSGGYLGLSLKVAEDAYRRLGDIRSNPIASYEVRAECLAIASKLKQLRESIPAKIYCKSCP